MAIGIVTISLGNFLQFTGLNTKVEVLREQTRSLYRIQKSNEERFESLENKLAGLVKLDSDH